MSSDLTPEQGREYALSRIRHYAIEHGLNGESIALIFQVGISPTMQLRPELFPFEEKTKAA